MSWPQQLDPQKYMLFYSLHRIYVQLNKQVPFHNSNIFIQVCMGLSKDNIFTRHACSDSNAAHLMKFSESFIPHLIKHYLKGSFIDDFEWEEKLEKVKHVHVNAANKKKLWFWFIKTLQWLKQMELDLTTKRSLPVNTAKWKDTIGDKTSIFCLLLSFLNALFHKSQVFWHLSHNPMLNTTINVSMCHCSTFLWLSNIVRHPCLAFQQKKMLSVPRTKITMIRVKGRKTTTGRTTP